MFLRALTECLDRSSPFINYCQLNKCHLVFSLILFCNITVYINLISSPYIVEKESCSGARGQLFLRTIVKVSSRDYFYKNMDNLSLSVINYNQLNKCHLYFSSGFYSVTSRLI